MMKKNKMHSITVFLLLALCTAVRLKGQLLAPAAPEARMKENIEVMPLEDIYLHIDRDKYIAGEDIWFSIYNIDREKESLSARSVVAYLELLNPWNKSVIQKRLQLSGGRGEGNFAIPDSVSSGMYTIRAYTNWMKNFLPENCFIHDIDIYNPFGGSEFWNKKDSADSSVTDADFPNKNEGRIILKADSIFSRREKVHMDLEVINYVREPSGISEMSISVTPAGISDASPDIGDIKISWKKASLKYRFESDGHYLSGKVKYREGNISDFSDFLYMSVQGKVAEFRYAGIDTAGRFSFVLPVDSRSRTLILQPDHATNNMMLEIEPSFSWIQPSSHYYKDILSDSIIEVFSELSFNYQAAKIYGTRTKKVNEINGKTETKKRRFYGIPEMEILLDDYIKLPSMEEVFLELLPGVILRSRKSEYEIKITNPLTGIYYDEPPLVMIDGVIINDLRVLVNLDPETVEKIEVVKTPYLIQDLILHGIVNVITRSGDFSNITMPDYAVIMPYRVTDKSPVFSAPDYSDDLTRNNRKPDLRNTLYWNPSMKTNRNGIAEIEFWTSDLPGNYTIKIQGISYTGARFSMNKSFTVR